jgi:hypothetical protein
MRIRLALFLSSYSLLFGLLGLRLVARPWLAASLGVLLLLGLAATAWIALGESRKQPISLTPVNIRDQGSEVAAYLVGYLLPFSTGGAPSDTDLMAYAIFFVVLVAVWLQSDLALINPLLYLAGWRIFEVETGTDRPRFLVARRRPIASVPLSATRLADDLFVVHTNGEDSDD